MENAEASKKHVIAQIKGGELTDGEIDRLSADMLSMPPKAVFNELISILKTSAKGHISSNIIRVLLELSAADDVWKRLLHKSITKKGRCPGAYRKLIKRFLIDGYDTLAFEQLFYQTFSGAAASPVTEARRTDCETRPAPQKLWRGFGGKRRDVRLKVDAETSSINGIGALLDKLGDMEKQIAGGHDLILDFRDIDHLYINGLCFLCAWCVRNELIPRIECNDGRTEEYLERVGFSSFVRRLPLQDIAVEDGSKNYIRICEIERDSETHTIAGDIASIIEQHGEVDYVEKTQLLILLSELIENVQRHSMARDTGYVVAQLYPQRNKLDISIIDTGIGIEASFLQGSNLRAKRKIEAGESPLDLACSALITSKPKGHAGYGLYLVSETVMRNYGTSLLSG